LLATAAQTLKNNIFEAKAALENNNYQKLGEVAHSMKGSLLNLGLDELALLAKSIETSAKKGEKTDFQTLLSPLYENLINH